MAHLLHHLEAGAPGGASVVFLHGGGLSGRQWQPQFEQLSSFHLLAPDLPEQGKSAGLRPFTLEDSAARVAELVRARATGGRAHIVGLSLGGAVGLELMRTHPELVASLFVSGTAAGLGRVLGAISLASAGLYDVLPRKWLVDASVKQFGIPPRYVDAFREDLGIAANAEFTRHYTRALMGMVLPDTATSPSLIAVGGRETIPARMGAKKLVAQVTGARGILVPRYGHVWNLEAPELFAETIRAWLSGEPLPGELQPLG